MSRPTDSTAAALARQLDALVHQGQRLLDRAAARRARQRGLRWALAGCAVVPMLALAIAAWRNVPVPVWLSASLVSPLLLAAIPLWSRRRRQDSRSAALALLDARAGAQGRLLAADQFLTEASRDGFREAAIADAQAWVGPARQAGEAQLVVPARPLERWRRAMPVLAASLLLCAFSIAVRDGVGQGDAPVTVAAGPLAGSDRRDAAAPVAERAPAVPAAARPRAPAAGSGSARADAAQPPAIDADPAHAAPSPGAAPGAPGAPGVAGAPGGGTATSADAAAAGDGDRRAGAPPRPGERHAPSDGATSQQAQGEPRSASDAAPADGNADGTPEAARSSPERASSSPSSSPAALSPGGAMPPAQPQAGQDPGQPPRRGPSESGDQGQSQGSGQGNGQRQGQAQDSERGLKRSRGLTGLLLGVPMQDQLTGTPNRGRVRSTARPGEPPHGSHAPAPAGTRGQQSGDSGRSGPHPASASDQQLVRDYFMRQRTRGDSATRESTS